MKKIFNFANECAGQAVWQAIVGISSVTINVTGCIDGKRYYALNYLVTIMIVIWFGSIINQILTNEESFIEDAKSDWSFLGAMGFVILIASFIITGIATY